MCFLLKNLGFVSNVAVLLVVSLVFYPTHQQTVKWQPATFQQTFQFNYSKMEPGDCPQPAAAYAALLQPAVTESQTFVPKLCTIQTEGLQFNGKLLIAGAEEQGPSILVNVSLVYDNLPTPVYNQCRIAVKQAFEDDNGIITAGFRGNDFSPLTCPRIANAKGAKLVGAGFFCKESSQILVSNTSSGRGDVLEITTGEREGGGQVVQRYCEFCPSGSEHLNGSNTCTECQQGFYRSMEIPARCFQCPIGFTTITTAAASKKDCWIGACEAGHYANTTSNGQCQPCPYGTYQPNKWQQKCIPCPGGFTTYQPAATSLNDCLTDCRPGEELLVTSSKGTCHLCPIGYFNDNLDPSRSTCKPCNEGFITRDPGSTSERDCVIRNCSRAGQYRDLLDNVCRDCPQGKWQDRPLQTTCHSCPVGFTTAKSGASDPADCTKVEPASDLPAAGLLAMDTRDVVVVALLVVVVILVLANVLTVGYCLYARKRHAQQSPSSPQQPEQASGTTLTSATGSADSDPKKWIVGDVANGDCVDYEDINLYAIIRDVLPRNPHDHPRNGASAAAAACSSSSSRPHAFTATEHSASNSYYTDDETAQSSSSFAVNGRRFLAASKEYSFAILSQHAMTPGAAESVQLRTFLPAPLADDQRMNNQAMSPGPSADGGHQRNDQAMLGSAESVQLRTFMTAPSVDDSHQMNNQAMGGYARTFLPTPLADDGHQMNDQAMPGSAGNVQLRTFMTGPASVDDNHQMNNQAMGGYARTILPAIPTPSEDDGHQMDAKAMPGSTDSVQLRTFMTAPSSDNQQMDHLMDDQEEEFDEIYDDVTNTGPIYENLAYGEAVRGGGSRGNWCSRMDTLY